MIGYRLTRTAVATRIVEVVEAILASPEWTRLSYTLSDLTLIEALTPFRRFFDFYEGREGAEWLGIMETMVVEEMRLRGPTFSVGPVTTDAIIARMARHPNVRFEG